MLRHITRAFPDAVQNNIVSGTKINQSRLTFSGQRGLVWVFWSLRVINGTGGLIDRVTPSRVGTAQVLGGWRAGGWFDASATRELTLVSSGVTVDPAEGSFFELEILLSGASVDIPASQSRITAFSFPVAAGEGPTMTVE